MHTIINSAGRFNCGGRCAFKAELRDGKKPRLVFDSKRTPCVKYCPRHAGYLDTFLSEDRLRYPLKRTGRRGDGAFTRISWEEAVYTITEKWQEIKAAHGPASRYVNYSTGVSALLRPDYFAKRLLALDSGFLDKYNSYSTAAAAYVTPYIYGTTMTGSSSSYLLKSKLIILWGHNPAETLFGAYLMENLERERKSGIPVIVIDPRRNDTAAALNARWIPLRPGTDGALAASLCYEIIKQHKEDRQFIDNYCNVFDRYEAYLFGISDGVIKDAGWAAEITGIDRNTIIELAAEYADAKPAAILSGWGPQRTSNGEQGVRAIAALCCAAGNVGKEGGSAGGVGYIRGHSTPALPAVLNPVRDIIPSFCWTDALEQGRIKMLFNLAGNTLINQHADINRTAALLRETENDTFIVVSDLFLTPSARFADIVLPAPSFLEMPNITMPWEEGDYLLHTNTIVPPVGESRFEYDWLSDIAKKLGLFDLFSEGGKTINDWLCTSYENLREIEKELPPYTQFKTEGGYFYRKRSEYCAFKKQIEDFPHNPFSTPSGKIEIYSERLFERGLPAVPEYTEGFETIHDPRIARFPFQLIGWHEKSRCHSIHDNNESMRRRWPHYCTINIDDAKEYGIKDGDTVEVYNDRGRIRILARVSADIMRSVLAIAQGAWWTPEQDSGTNGTDIRGNINTLTTQRPTPLAGGNAQHSNLVALCKMTVS